MFTRFLSVVCMLIAVKILDNLITISREDIQRATGQLKETLDCTAGQITVQYLIRFAGFAISALGAFKLW